MDHCESGRAAVSNEGAADFLRRRREARDEEKAYMRWLQSDEAKTMKANGKAIPRNYWFFIKYRNHYPWIVVALATMKLTNGQPRTLQATSW